MRDGGRAGHRSVARVCALRAGGRVCADRPRGRETTGTVGDEDRRETRGAREAQPARVPAVGARAPGRVSGLTLSEYKKMCERRPTPRPTIRADTLRGYSLLLPQVRIHRVQFRPTPDPLGPNRVCWARPCMARAMQRELPM